MQQLITVYNACQKSGLWLQLRIENCYSLRHFQISCQTWVLLIIVVRLTNDSWCTQLSPVIRPWCVLWWRWWWLWVLTWWCILCTWWHRSHVMCHLLYFFTCQSQSVTYQSHCHSSITVSLINHNITYQSQCYLSINCWYCLSIPFW